MYQRFGGTVFSHREMLESLVHIYKQQSATFQKAVIFRDPKISQINVHFKIHVNIILQPRVPQKLTSTQNSSTGLAGPALHLYTHS